jgi:hypothetical protein
VKPVFELATSQAQLLDNFPLVIGNSDLEYTLGQINSNGSSMRFGLLSSKTDPHPHEHRQRQFGAEKTGESIPSIQRIVKKLRFWRPVIYSARGQYADTSTSPYEQLLCL